MHWIVSLVSFVISLRYRIEEKGGDLSLFNKGKGVLLLPNHSSRIDPFILIVLFLQKGIRLRPIATDYLFQWRWLLPLLRWTGAIPTPDFDFGVTPDKMAKIDQAFAQIRRGLEQGEHFLFFPAGRIKKSPREIVGGASGAYLLAPNSEIVLLRMTGLWGSGFSRALTEEMPDFGKVALSGIKAVFSNGLFFMPRRKIRIEMEQAPLPLRQSKSRLEFNRHLEMWYNCYPEVDEPLQIVPLRWWSRRVPKAYSPSAKINKQMSSISPEISARVYGEIARLLNQPSMQIEPKMNLSTDLGLDSINVAELSAFLAQHRKTQKFSFDELQTVQDVLELADTDKKL